MNASRWVSLGFGAAAAVVASLGIPAPSIGVLIAAGVACAVVAVVFDSLIATLLLLGVVVAGPAAQSTRPSALQIALLAAAIAGFLLAPHWRRVAEPSWLAAAVGVPLAAAAVALAENTARGTAQYLIGLVALIIAFVVALRPVLGALRRR